MANAKTRMNIATSCNDRYARYVFINLINVHEVLSRKYDIHFYLMESNISEENLSKLREFSDKLDFNFHIVHIENDEFLKNIAHYARASDSERFYDGACHLFLPDDLDRVLYVDTGDVLFLSEEYDFYYEDFLGKSLLVSSYWDLKKDRWDFDQLQGLWGGFNSGHMLVNLDQLRRMKLGPQDYINYVEKWARHFPEKNVLYGGDQAFLTAFFAGDISVIKKDNPYNVKVVALNGKIPTTPPKSIHLNAMFGNIKPWEVPFTTSKDLERLKISVPMGGRKGSDFQVYFSKYENECVLKWWDFCKRTPVYDDLKMESYKNMKLLSLLSRYIRDNDKANVT